jgi:hypothetical protein
MDSSLEELSNALRSAAGGMSSQQLRWHPDGKWCAGEILEHLYLTYTGTIKGFQKVLAANKPLTTRATLRQRLRRSVVIGLGHMPEGRKAPANTVPKGLPPETVRDDICAKIAAMDAAITECEARFGRKVRLLDHPILGPLTATQWRKFHLVHGLHHHKQLLRLSERIGQEKQASGRE